MSTSRTRLLAIAPEFAAESTDRLDVFLAMAAERCDSTEWGTHYLNGCVYLAAHLLTLSARGAGAGAGPVVSRSAGEVSVNYGAVVGVLDSNAKYATTPYGIEYLNLRSLVAIGAMVV